jgi:hypothetical protein
MNKVYLWLSGLFTAPAVVHLVRVAIKMRLDVTWHRFHYRVPLKVSLIIGILCLLLAIVFYLSSRKEGQ